MEEERKYKRGLWTEEEDRVLIACMREHKRARWNSIPKFSGLKRSGKSCRLRWLNYLSPNVKHGHFSEEEDDLIIRLHNLLGNRWSLIAGRVPGRTDNQVKNHWNTHLKKKFGIRKLNARKIESSSTLQTQSRIEKKEINEVISSNQSLLDSHDRNGAPWMDDYWIETMISNEHLNINSLNFEFFDGFLIHQNWHTI